jgi:hypothetical protein
MTKYCPLCGIENPKEAVYCGYCGTRFDFRIQQGNNDSLKLQHHEQNKQCYTPKKPFWKNKPVIAIAVIGVVAILIGVLFMTGFINDEDINDSYINKIHVKGGPKVNIESIVSSGNALTTPAEGYTAVYGYYLSSSKIGEISFTTEGEEYYNGKQCDKIIGGGNFNFDIYGQSVGANFDIGAYISKSDGILANCRYSFDFNKPYNINMDMILDIDKEEGEITATVDSSLMSSTSTVIKVSDEFWDCTLLEENLYVGYIKEVTYSIYAYGYDAEVNLKISVIGQEDVTVKKGTFEDCYIVQIDQVQGSATTTSKIWIDENGICPKMQIGSSGSSSISYEGMTIELEEYYTTDYNYSNSFI